MGRKSRAWEEPKQPAVHHKHPSIECSTNVAADILAEKRYNEEADAKKAEEYRRKVQDDIGKGNKAAMISRVLNVDPKQLSGQRLVLHQVMSHWTFDCVIGLVITLNAFTIGVETQYKSTVPFGCTPECDCKLQVDKTRTCLLSPDWVTNADYVFFAVYLLEVSLRFGVYGPGVLRSNWVKFDAFLVCSAIVDFALASIGSRELQTVMLVRMLRLFRLARALRLMVQFKTLWQLVQGLFHSIGTLLWTFLLVAILMYISSIVGMEFIKVDPNLPLDHAYNIAAVDNFRNFMDAMLTILQIFSFDSIGAIYRPLIKRWPAIFLYFIMVILLLSIALMNLVTAVMVNSALDQASEDKDAKKAWEAAKKAKQIEQLKTMFLELDEDGSGELTMDEIHGAPLEAQEQLQEIAGTDDLKELFETLDYDGGGTVEVEEFCQGVLKATSCQPGVLELGRLLKQCGDILKKSRETAAILTDPAKGFKEYAKKVCGRGDLDDGTDAVMAKAAGDDAVMAEAAGDDEDDEDVDRLNAKVTHMEGRLEQIQTDVARILHIVSDRVTPSKPKSAGMSHRPARRDVMRGLSATQ